MLKFLATFFAQGSDMLLRNVSAAAFCAGLALGSAARADWEGDLKMKAGHGQNARGKMRFKEGKLRMEMAMGPMQMTTIVDFATRKMFMINDGAREYSEMDATHNPQANYPHCDSSDFIACMGEQGFKKVGSETVNGQPSTVWEGDRTTPRGAVHEKLWHPNAAGKEFAFVRAVSRTPRGESQTDVENFKATRQDEAAFKVPEGYTKSENMFPGMQMGPPSMKGFRPKPGGPTGGEVKEKEKEGD